MSYSQVGTLTTFSSGQVISSSDVNSNFAALKAVLNGVVTGTNTLSANQIDEVTATQGVTVDGVLLKDGAVTATAPSTFDDISCVDLTISGTASFGPSAITGGGTFGTGAYTFPSTLTVTTDLTVSGDATVTGDLTADSNVYLGSQKYLATEDASLWGGNPYQYLNFIGHFYTTGASLQDTITLTGLTMGYSLLLVVGSVAGTHMSCWFARQGSGAISPILVAGASYTWANTTTPTSLQVGLWDDGTPAILRLTTGSGTGGANFSVFAFGGDAV